MIEIWKPIKGYEGLYEVSNYGRIKRLTRVYYNSFGKKITLKEKIVNGNGKNYRKFNLVGENGEHLEQGVHIIVAKAFPEICGEWFEGCHTHHKDFNPSNNIADNLIILTEFEHLSLHSKGENNCNYGNHNKRPEISNAIKGKRKPYKHKPIIQLTLDGEFIKEWECIADIHTELGYSIGNICMCCQGKLKTAYKYLWRYKEIGDSKEPPIS